VLLFGGALAGAVRTSLVPFGGEASLDTWRDLLADPAFADSVVFTLRVALLSTVLSAALALLIALRVRRRSALLRTALALPVPVPHLLVGVAAVLWLAPGGLADRLLGGLPVDLVRDEAGLGVVLVYVYKEAPFLVVLLLAAMGKELAEREEAAAVLGASARQRLRWVVWPAIRSPLVVGSIVVAAFVIGAFEVPLAVGPTYPTTLAQHALEATQGDLLAGEGTAAATLLVAAAASIALAVLAVRFAKDQQGG
jgi:putative spermidine/putrescine transport system permease protein